MDSSTATVSIIAIIVTGMTISSVFSPATVKTELTKKDILNKELLRLHAILDDAYQSTANAQWARTRIEELYAEILKMDQTEYEGRRDYCT